MQSWLTLLGQGEGRRGAEACNSSPSPGAPHCLDWHTKTLHRRPEGFVQVMAVVTAHRGVVTNGAAHTALEVARQKKRREYDQA
jgi:hypothetical protein